MSGGKIYSEEEHQAEIEKLLLKAKKELHEEIEKRLPAEIKKRVHAKTEKALLDRIKPNYDLPNIFINTVIFGITILAIGLLLNAVVSKTMQPRDALFAGCLFSIPCIIYTFSTYFLHRNSLRFLAFFKALEANKNKKNELKYGMEYSIKRRFLTTEFKINLKNNRLD